MPRRPDSWRSPQRAQRLLLGLVLTIALLAAMAGLRATAVSATSGEETSNAAQLVSGSAEPSEAPGDFPHCRWNCTANDVRLQAVWLGDASGQPLALCDPGSVIETAWVWVSLRNNTNTDRYYVHVVADVSVDDGPSLIISACLASPLPPDHTTHGLRLAQVNDVPCGSTVWLRNIIIPWNANPEGGGETCEFSPGSCNAWQPAKCAGEADQGIIAEPEPSPTPTQTLVPTPTDVPPPEPTPTDVPPAEPTATLTPTPVEPTPTTVVPPTEPQSPTPTLALVAQPESPPSEPETSVAVTSEQAMVVLADEVEQLPEVGTVGGAGGNPMLTLSVISVGLGAGLVWLRRRLA